MVRVGCLVAIVMLISGPEWGNYHNSRCYNLWKLEQKLSRDLK